MGPNEQNPHFTELTQNVVIYIQQIVLLRGLPSLDGEHKLSVSKKRKIGQPSLSQIDLAISM